MPHSLGHYIGFKVHDVGLQRQIADSPDAKFKPYHYNQPMPVSIAILRKGMVTTIEPGIYFIEDLI